MNLLFQMLFECTTKRAFVIGLNWLFFCLLGLICNENSSYVSFRFKYKYHPEECSKRHEEQHAALQRRLQIFLELMAQNRVDSCSVDVEKSDELIKILDAGKIPFDYSYLLVFTGWGRKRSLLEFQASIYQLLKMN